jgi:hypothetical protein
MATSSKNIPKENPKKSDENQAKEDQKQAEMEKLSSDYWDEALDLYEKGLLLVKTVFSEALGNFYFFSLKSIVFLITTEIPQSTRATPSSWRSISCWIRCGISWSAAKDRKLKSQRMLYQKIERCL